MRTDELTRALEEAREIEPPADAAAGRRGVARRLRSRQAERWTVVVVALVFGVAVTWVAVTRVGTGDHRVGSDLAEVPHLIPTYLPPGAELRSAFELPPLDPDEEHLGSTVVVDVVWTTTSTEHPPADNVPMVMMRSATGLEPGSRPDILVFPLGANAGAPDAVVWADDVDPAVLSAFTSDAVVGDDGTVSLDPPEDFREVHRSQPKLMSAPWVTAEDFRITWSNVPFAGYALEYTTPDAAVGVVSSTGTMPSPSIYVTRTPRSYEWWLEAASDSLEPVEVRGRPGFRVSLSRVFTAGGIRMASEVPSETLVWWEDDDVMVRVSAVGDRAALPIAESLREVDQAGWEAFVATATHSGA